MTAIYTEKQNGRRFHAREHRLGFWWCSWAEKFWWAQPYPKLRLPACYFARYHWLRFWYRCNRMAVLPHLPKWVTKTGTPPDHVIGSFVTVSMPWSRNDQNGGRRNGPKLSPFDRSTGFDAFVFKFQWLAQSYYWDGSMKLLKLMETLTGKALDIAWPGKKPMCEHHMSWPSSSYKNHLEL